MPTDVSPALSLRFDVTVDGVEIGSFSEVDGLQAEYEVEEYIEGGQNDYVHRLRGRMKYTNIRLKRAVNGDSGDLAGWFTSFGPSGSGDRTTGSIKAINGNSDVVATWSLRDVWPVKYSGPALGSSKSEVALETLELAHHGFSQE